jgi:hypothetical protein
VSEQVIERQFHLLTVNRVGGQLLAFPRPTILTLRRNGQAQLQLNEQTCTFDPRFRRAVRTVWEYLRALLPEESAGWSLELTVKARGNIGGGSIGLPLTLVLLGAVLEQPLPDALYGTGLLCLADGWFTGQLLSDMEAKAQALAPLAGLQNGEVILAIPHHRQVPLPNPVPGVHYLRLAHVAHAAAELFARHAERVKQRFRALSTLERLPFEPEIKEAFRQNKAQAIVLECTSRDPVGEREIEISRQSWGSAVWVRYPGLPGGGAMAYRFEGEQLCDKEHFASREEARALGGLLATSNSGGSLAVFTARGE